jgi:sigma-B regulation protein RsbU (phosphoserine phosphatase)
VPAARRPGRIGLLRAFWRRVTEGQALGELSKQFRSEAHASYRLYRRDFEARSPRETPGHRWLQTAQELVWAILEKLTPARRVLLLAGVVLLALPSGGFSHRGRGGDVEIFQFDSHFYGGVLLFVVLMLEIADRVVMKRDLEIARDIQQWLLPSAPPEIAGLEIAFAARPANTVAGDFYDVFPRPLTHSADPGFLFAVADVAGKSIPAALLMATFQASLKTLSATPCSLAELLAAMNHYACSNSQDGRRFITAFLAEFDPASRSLTYINAGHNAPIVRRASGAIERLSDGGLPLGIQDHARYDARRVALQAGDWLVIFTDGLVEAVDSRGQEYGEQRLLGVLHAATAAAPQDLLGRMMRDLDAFVGATPQHDDVTCVLAKVV